MKFLKQLFYSALATSGIIVVVVALMLFGVIPYNADMFGKFLIGAVLLILGQTVFLISIDNGIIKVGKLVGVALMKKRSILLIVIFGVLFGLVTTLAEPDVQVMVNTISGVNSFLSSWALLSVCAVGCGLFVALGFLRILKNIPIKWVLLALYSIIIVLGFFVPNDYFGMSFDLSGVTTGSVTVPFVLALAVGLCAIRGKSQRTDTFGVMAIASIGPILAMMILGIIVGAPESVPLQTTEVATFFDTLIECFADVGIAIIPLFATFMIANFLMLKLSWREVVRICLLFLMSAVGLVAFLTGVNYGFSGMGNFIGQGLVQGSVLVMILFGAVMGLLFVFTDPSIVVIVGQVEEITMGGLKKPVVFITLGIGLALAMATALLYVAFQINLMYILLPVLVAELALNFVVPKMFSALAFDCGGAASGTMTVAFMFPVCMGVCSALGGGILSGFGVIGIVALVPILSVQVLGVVYGIKQKCALKREVKLEKN